MLNEIFSSKIDIMRGGMAKVKTTIKLLSKEGLDARPAFLLVQRAKYLLR